VGRWGLLAQQGVFELEVGGGRTHPDLEHHAEKLGIAHRGALCLALDEESGALARHILHPCAWPWMKKVVPLPGTYSMAKVSPATSLGLPEKMSINRVLDAVCFCTSSGEELLFRPLMKASPKSVPGTSRRATKFRRLGPANANRASGVLTLLWV